MRQIGVLIALLGVSACDKDNPVRHLDGGVTIDAPTIDAPAQPVALTITRNGAPRQGVVVHFQNADSSLVGTEMTDATGRASRVMNAGGYVTAVDPFAVQAGQAISTLRTFASVKPGDQLKLASDDPPSVTMTVTLPVQANPGTIRYVVDSTCGGRSGVMSNGSGFQPIILMSFRPGCTTADISAVSLNGSAVAGYFIVNGETITANGTLDYSMKSYTTPTPRTYTVNNVPNDINTIVLSQHILNANGALVTLSQDTTGGAPTSTAMIGVPSVTNGVSVIVQNASAGTSDYFLYDWAPLATSGFVTDFGARRLVSLSEPTYDVATHTALWTEGSGTAPDLAYLGVFGTRTTTPNSFGVDWQLIGPHAAGIRAFPALPITNIDYNFDADDVVEVTDLVLAKSPGGYDAIRANAFLLDVVVHQGEVADLAMTATGMLSHVQYLQPQTLAVPPTTTLRHRIRR